MYQELIDLETWAVRRAKLNAMLTELYSLIPSTKQNTIFVDPDGDDRVELDGRLNIPWATISGALSYLSDNNLQNYTILVFPGIYANEGNWSFCNDQTQREAPFNNNNNTTVKLQGSVNIINEGTLISLNNDGAGGIPLNVSIVGDAKGSINNDLTTNAVIHTENGNNIEFNSSYTRQNEVSDINFNVSNIAFICGKKGYGSGYGRENASNDMYNITYKGYVTGVFTAQNCSFKNHLTSNFSCPTGDLALWDATLVFKDTYWETDNMYSYANWNFNDSTNFETIAYFSLENTKFCKKGIYSYEPEHILTNSFNEDNRYVMNCNNVIFYSVASGSYMWKNICPGVHTSGAKIYLTGHVFGNQNTFVSVDTMTGITVYGDYNLIDVSIFQE